MTKEKNTQERNLSKPSSSSTVTTTSIIDQQLENYLSPNSSQKTDRVGVTSQSNKEKKFRVQGKNFWLTYARCTLEPKSVFEELTCRFSPRKPVYGRVITALHQDGTPHIHAILCLDGTIDKRNAHFADVSNVHGNYKVFRSKKDLDNMMRYCDKQVIKEYVYGAIAESTFPGKPSTQPMSALITQELADGAQTRSLIQQARYQPYLLRNLQKVIYFENYLKKTLMNTLLPFPKLRTKISEQNSRILRWLGMNLFEESRPLRTPQLFLDSKPGKGKTTLVTTLEKCIRTYKPSIGEKYFDGLTEEHDLIVFEEFSGNWPIGLMNQILDGQTCLLPQRYQSFWKTRNVPIIICGANIHPHECYKNAHQERVHAFISRLHVIDVFEFIEIFEVNYS